MVDLLCRFSLGRWYLGRPATPYNEALLHKKVSAPHQGSWWPRVALRPSLIPSELIERASATTITWLAEGGLERGT